MRILITLAASTTVLAIIISRMFMYTITAMTNGTAYAQVSFAELSSMTTTYPTAMAEAIITSPIYVRFWNRYPRTDIIMTNTDVISWINIFPEFPSFCAASAAAIVNAT